MTSCLRKPFFNMKRYICELFLKIDAFSANRCGSEPQTEQGGEKVLRDDHCWFQKENKHIEYREAGLSLKWRKMGQKIYSDTPTSSWTDVNSVTLGLVTGQVGRQHFLLWKKLNMMRWSVQETLIVFNSADLRSDRQTSALNWTCSAQPKRFHVPQSKATRKLRRDWYSDL